MSWSSRKKKRAFFVPFISSKGKTIWVLSQCVLNKLSEYTYFYISKNITSYTCCLFLKLTKPSVYPEVILILHDPFLVVSGILPLFSPDLKCFYRFYFTMHNRFILIFLSLWYCFSAVIVQPCFIAQSRFGSFLAF